SRPPPVGRQQSFNAQRIGLHGGFRAGAGGPAPGWTPTGGGGGGGSRASGKPGRGGDLAAGGGVAGASTREEGGRRAGSGASTDSSSRKAIDAKSVMPGRMASTERSSSL